MEAMKKVSRIIHVGFGNTVAADRVIAVVAPGYMPLKRLLKNAEESMKVVDASHGKKVRSLIFMDSGHVVLSTLDPKTIAYRFDEGEGLKHYYHKREKDDGEEE